MICPACNKSNVDTVSFCEFCGANLRAATGAPVAAATMPVQPPIPSAAEVAQMGKHLIRSLTLGEKFVAAGAIAAAIGFFLPWVSSPDLGELAGLLGNLGANAASHISLSGVDVAKMVGAIYIILLAAIASGVLFYLSRKSDPSKKLMIAGFQVMIGAMFGPGYLAALFFVPMIQSVAGAGFWLLGFGFSAIAAGGLITIAALRKAA